MTDGLRGGALVGAPVVMYSRHAALKEVFVAIHKVIEVLSQSDESWEDAAQVAVTKTAKTVHNVKSIYIDNFEATVDEGKLKKYRINAKISFMLD